MRRHNPENERIQRAYFTYLKEGRRLSEHSIDAAAAALDAFETYTRYRDFKRFHNQQAVGFKRNLSEQVSQHTGDRLSKSTLFTTLNALGAFFQWLAGQPGYRSRLTYADADYFALSEKETRIAKASHERPGGLSRSHWSNATPVRTIFKEAFTSAGLPYSNPHSFTKTLTQLGERICHTPEQFKAWSQNLGHETVLTTFSSYGEIARERQAELIRQLGQVKSQTTVSKDALDTLLRFIQEQRGES